MIRVPPRPTRTDTLFPNTPLFLAPASLQAAKDAGVPVLAYCQFINALINFMIIAWALFIVVRQMNKLRRRFEEPAAPAAPAAPPREEVLLTEIRDLLKRSEEHTSELQSLMRISYAVFCLKKKNTTQDYTKETR